MWKSGGYFFLLLSTICRRATINVPSSNNCSNVKYRISPPFARQKEERNSLLSHKKEQPPPFLVFLGALARIYYILLVVICQYVNIQKPHREIGAVFSIYFKTLTSKNLSAYHKKYVYTTKSNENKR